MSKADTLEVLLQTLRAAVPQIRGALVASTDGRPLASSLPQGADPAKFAALVGTLTDHGERLGEGAHSASFTEAVIQGDEGQAFLFSAFAPHAKAVLAVFADLPCNTGLIRFESRKIAAIVASIL